MLIFSELKVPNLLIYNYRYARLICNIRKFLDIYKQVAGNLVNEYGNMPRRGVVPRFSDLEVIALNMTSEAIGIDSESFFFAKLLRLHGRSGGLIRWLCARLSRPSSP